jgi:DNA mismatch repair protein MutL
MAESLHPVFLLFIQVPPETVDVNVHPQKREVRFRDEGKIYNIVRTAVANALGKEEAPIAPMPWEFTPGPSIPFVLHDAPQFVPQPSLPIEAKGRPVALVGDFLLVEEQGWKWVDLRGAEARILFEQMEKGKAALQPLMWPHEMELGVGDSAEETADLLKEVGVEARAMGKRKIAIDALPVGMETSHIEPFIQQFLVQKTERRLAASLTRVCRASSRRFSFEEGALIWRKLTSCKDRNYDPLGKKIIAIMGEEQLAEFFV